MLALRPAPTRTVVGAAIRQPSRLEQDETVSNYKDDTPKSGVPGISWHKANGNWVVRHKVKGVEQFLGSFDDLEDAKRVKAEAMLLREPSRVATMIPPPSIPTPSSPRPSRSMTTATRSGGSARLPGTWRACARTPAGTRATRARSWTSAPSSSAQDICGPRTSSLGLVAIRERPEALDEAVTPRWKQTSGMPQRGDYEAVLATVRALPTAEREAHTKRLEGLIIAATPVAEGPLAKTLMRVKREIGMNQRDLYVLSGMKDPFAQDTPTGHQLGRWLKVRLDLFAPGRVIHLRGVHYLLVATQALKPDGTPYTNTKVDYFWLNDRVAKAARWLRYIPFDRIIDERNEEPVIARALRGAMAIPNVYVSTGYSGVDLPRRIGVHRAEPHATLAGFRPEQRFCFAVFGEKSSLSEVLRPFAERHGADLFIATGELSERRAYEMARDAVRDGRKLVVFTFSRLRSERLSDASLHRRQADGAEGAAIPELRVHRPAGGAHPRRCDPTPPADRDGREERQAARHVAGRSRGGADRGWPPDAGRG